MTKGELTARNIMREVKGAKVVCKQLDLADTKSICQFAENIYNSGWRTRAQVFRLFIQVRWLMALVWFYHPPPPPTSPPAEKGLHYLINNAGVAMCPYSITEDGYEMQFGVNHLGIKAKMVIICFGVFFLPSSFNLPLSPFQVIFSSPIFCWTCWNTQRLLG